jgi:hypothetical protein
MALSGHVHRKFFKFSLESVGVGMVAHAYNRNFSGDVPTSQEMKARQKVSKISISTNKLGVMNTCLLPSDAGEVNRITVQATPGKNVRSYLKNNKQKCWR